MHGFAIFFMTLALAAGPAAMAAEEIIPLPRPRPNIPFEPRSFAEANPGLFDTAELTTEPSDCRLRLAEMAEVEPLPRLIGPGECGGSDMVRIEYVLMPDKSRVAIKPAPVLNCPMAESLAAWLRDDVAPRTPALGAKLREVRNYDDYNCRTRNRVFGAMVSEHGKGNALDVRWLKLDDGRIVYPVDITIDKEFRDAMRQSACARFTTVLGPGADSAHESHIHLDQIERTNGYRLCQWEVREPPKVGEEIAGIPLPQPRPAVLREMDKQSRRL